MLKASGGKAKHPEVFTKALTPSSLILGYSTKELLDTQHGLLRKLVEVDVLALAVFAAVKDFEAEDAAETGLEYCARDLLDGQVAAGIRERPIRFAPSAAWTQLVNGPVL